MGNIRLHNNRYNINLDEESMPVRAKKIIDLLSKVKRMSAYCHHHEYHDCVMLHLKKIEMLMYEKKKITFILPAFPAKSPNNIKTFNTLPDMGERLALNFLNQLCELIKQFYLPGAEMIICSDGRVFNDLVKVKDKDVDTYSYAIDNIIHEDSLTNISLFSLDNHYKDSSYETMRTHLLSEYGESEDIIKNNIKNDLISRQQFNGIHRFIFEDNISALPSISKNKIRNISKKIAYQVIQRSNAWSVLLEKYFPSAIRLSIHPQICGSNKIGIMLLKSEDAWATPWHRVVLYDGKEHILIRKKDAENLGAVPVFIKNQFSHFTVK